MPRFGLKPRAPPKSLGSLREQATESIRLAQEAQQKAEAENLGMQHVVEQLREEIRAEGRERSLQLERDLASERGGAPQRPYRINW